MREFPDLKTVVNTLTHLELKYDQIVYINPTFLEALQILVGLNLRSNTLSSFPDVRGPAILTKLVMNSNNFVEFPMLKTSGASVEEIVVFWK